MSDNDNIIPIIGDLNNRENLKRLGEMVDSLELDCYILDSGKKPRKVKMSEYMVWTMTGPRTHVACDFVGGVQISTIFLGIDHSFFRALHPGAPPRLFETMMFGGEHHGYQTRCSTWEEAEKMHADAVALIKRGHLRIVK